MASAEKENELPPAESHRIAVEFIYARWPEPLRYGQAPELPVDVDQRYVRAAAPVVREQLAKASVRLAMVLNRALQ